MPEMAVRLGKALGGSADVWLQMQVSHDLAQIRRRAGTIHDQAFQAKVGGHTYLMK